MKKALIVGINNYPRSPLSGCENDAKRIFNLLARHENGERNFDCRIKISSETSVTQEVLRASVMELFQDECDSALFYFSGHGSKTETGGVLVTTDYTPYNRGLSMDEVVGLAGRATAAKRIREVFLIADCCHSGSIGDAWFMPDGGILPGGVSILTACAKDQVALESNAQGLFTARVCDALEGGAADVLGKVTAASIYSYLDQTFGAWDQRPLFKANLSKLEPIRQCLPAVALDTLRKITSLFPSDTYIFPLAPDYEPTEKRGSLEKEAAFAILQKYRAARLLIPNGEEHLYHAALASKSCQLTPLGRFYWKMVQKGMI